MAARPGRISPLVAVGVASRFAWIAWREAWPALGLASLAAGLWLNSPRDWIWFGVAVVSGWMAQGALYRVAFDCIVHRGGLHIGHVEWRLASAWLLTFGFLVIIASLMFVVLLAGAYAVASAGAGFIATRPTSWPAAVDGRGRWVLGILTLAGATALALTAVRLSLSGAATTAIGRVQVLATWVVTRGQIARLITAFLIAGGAPLALMFGIAAMRAGHPAPLPAAAITLLAGAAALGLWLPLRTGLVVHAYRALAPEVPPVSDLRQ
ncbi:MAG: hypothetical protein ABI056_05950 [Caulobacteraceae bacterium]